MKEKGLVTVVNENDEVIGLERPSVVRKRKLIHRSSHLLLFDQNKRVLLQERTSDALIYPRLRSFSVNGTVEDETYEQCIHREMQEELGLSLHVTSLFTFNDIYAGGQDRAFKRVFYASYNGQELTINRGEVGDVVWMLWTELKKDIAENPRKYVPPFLKGISQCIKEYEHRLPIST